MITGGEYWAPTKATMVDEDGGESFSGSAFHMSVIVQWS